MEVSKAAGSVTNGREKHNYPRNRRQRPACNFSEGSQHSWDCTLLTNTQRYELPSLLKNGHRSGTVKHTWCSRATAHICGIPVTARPPTDPNVSRGFVYGGEPEIQVSQILEGLASSVPVGTVEKRAERSILLHFQGPTTPPTIYLFRIRLELKPCRPRPVQCCRCGRLHHVTSCCRGPSRCSRCGGGGHERASCSAAAPHCNNCGVEHSVDNPQCPHWLQERQVAMALLQSTKEESRMAVRAKIWAEEAAIQPMIAPASNMQIRRYADAAKQRRILKQQSMNAEKQGTQPTLCTTNAGQGVASTDRRGTTEVNDRPDAAIQAHLTAVQAIASTLQPYAPAYHIWKP
ncbi:hypothetical protein HPB48_000636 [Haemaphysalis longicornis]|uniref:Tick transposon n=1 Tax=Haemaphysalis longicornis TaxID=44386 RepID=A0A9J6GCB3_HAELO|nr:hypothetical protein HPB48_000636 [Haemaphysalis longicornis]